MGAFAGSAALLCQQRRAEIAVITLTMNNSCNLSCPHCYLQFAGHDAFVDPDVVEAIAESPASIVSIVGMEPLKDRTTAQRLRVIVDRLKRSGKTVGLITNGLNAHLLDPETAKLIDWIDVSVDGTRSSYGSIRGASVSKLERSIGYLHRVGVRQVNVLHTIHALNIADLPELMRFGRELCSGSVIISPYSATRHEGVQADDLAISPEQFVDALEEQACDLAACWLVLDADWLRPLPDLERTLSGLKARFSGRAVIFEDDPVHYGMLRVTYDSRVMTPREAMHTRSYRDHEPRRIAIRDLRGRGMVAPVGPLPA